MTTVHTIDTVVVGAGHAGLAVSRLLTQAGRDHVVLDRGRIGERWRSERWDSLHLLTPSWMTRLPGWYYSGPDPEGYLSAGRFVRSLERYAESFDAPVIDDTTVHRLDRAPGGRYHVHTDRGTFRATHVVVATGPHGAPVVPAGFDGSDVEVMASSRYRNPDQLASGGVLVVGASSSGVQIADELNRAGRDVVLAVGRHTRMPRRYRGMDAFWWLESTGRLARTIDDFADPVQARREPSLQLVGRNGPGRFGQDLDLAALHGRGVRLTGRLHEVSASRAAFDEGLAGTVAAADEQMHRFLDRVDRYVEETGLQAEVLPPERPRRFVPAAPPRELDLRREGIATIVLATGFRPDHSWIHLPITTADGHLEQYRGVTPAPGVYTVGQRFQHRRDSGFIDGARHDAHAVVAHLVGGSVPQEAAQQGKERAA
jgi:putative flavoprotein involved in K+ transport